MTSALLLLSAVVLGFVLGWACALRQVGKRKSKADDLRYMLSPVIPHSPEDAFRRFGG